MIEPGLKTRLIWSGLTRTEAAEKAGVSLFCINSITKDRERIVSKAFGKCAFHVQRNDRIINPG